MNLPDKDNIWCGSDSNAQAVLNALPGSKKSEFSGSSWLFQFPDEPEKIINFEDINELKYRYPAWHEMINLDLINISKLAWLEAASNCSHAKWKQKLSGLALFWTALAETNCTKLSLDNISDVFTYLLTHSWRHGKQHRLKCIHSYRTFTVMFSILALRASFNASGKEVISKNIGNLRITKTLKTLIPELTNSEFTYPEWIDGGSTNYLTLDYGQYYVEHCLKFFEEHVVLATAIDLTFKNIPTFSRDCNLNPTTTARVVSLTFDGFSSKEILTRLSGPGRSPATETIDRVYHATCAYFEKTYRYLSFRDFILNITSLKRILESLNIEITPDQIDRIKIIVWHWLDNRFEDALYLMETCSLRLWKKEFESIILLMKTNYEAQRFNIPLTYHYLSIGLKQRDSKWNTHNRYSRQLVRLVQQAGLTSIVAMTGWRKSEFGFPISAIKYNPNHDILDQYAFPIRCHVEWYVNKTHGSELTNREITFDIALMAERLSQLNSVEDGDPCLYRCNKKAAERKNSGKAVTRSVTGMWQHFVENYSGFQSIKELDSWRCITEMNDQNPTQCSFHDREKERLLSIRSADDWNSLQVDRNLQNAWIRARTELPIINFIYSNAGSDKKVNWLEKFVLGDLPHDWTDLLNTRLTMQTRDWLNSLSATELRLSTVVRTVTYELLDGCLYPTPHSFRHMFVEAVYRRFDGDVGWMIRSMFKHISKSMWLAYTKDKLNRGSHQLGKMRVISALVNNYIQNKGAGYAGSMHTWLRRLIKSPTIMTPDEQEEFANHISTVEIIDIKASPWGYCLLKSRTQSKSRCAEYGEPQRHNASPELCLSCIHNLMHSDNIDWIILHLNTHVEALQNPVVPKIFKASSFNLVKTATKHIHTLNPKHEALHELQQVLAAYCEAA